MKKILLAVTLLTSLTTVFCSCSEQYAITGSTSQDLLDGRMAYVKQAYRHEFMSIDSCEVVHGQFEMTGSVDTVKYVEFFMDDRNVKPMVLEHGNISISVVDANFRVSGTPLNDALYDFLFQRDSLTMILNGLDYQAERMFNVGYDMEEINKRLNKKAEELTEKLEQLETKFIKDNYKNILGVTWFLQLCDDVSAQYGFPVATKQIENLYQHAPASFRKNPDIQAYMKLAKKVK